MVTGEAGSLQKKVEIRFHHGGTFEGNPKSSYLNGKVELMEHYDTEEICYWSLLSMVHQLEYGFNEVKRLYFLEPGKSLVDGLKLLFDDNSVLELSNHLNKFGEISVYVDHAGDGNEESSNVPLPEAFFVSVDDSSDDGKEGTREDVIEYLDINLSSDEGDDELAPARKKARESEKDSKRFHTEDVGGLGPSRNQKTEDGCAVPSKPHGIDHYAAGQSGRNGMTDNGVVPSRVVADKPASDCIDLDDPGSYVTASDGLNAVDAQRVLSHDHAVGNQGFFVGQIFKDAAQFKKALKDHSLQKQFKYRHKKNEQVRVRAKCAADGCLWEILASRHGNDNSFRVKTYFDEHSCLLTTHKKRVTSDHQMPRKGRRKGVEGPKKVKMSRVGNIMKCSICHKEGHNKTKCRTMPNIQSSHLVNVKNVANKRKASASTAPKATSRNNDRPSKRMKNTKKALP